MRKTPAPLTVGWLVLMIALALPGCRHAPPREGAGRSSFAFLEQPAGPPPTTMATETTQTTNRSQWGEATLKEPLVLPVYPQRALKAKAGRNLVGVHITVDPTGRVSDVRMSMLVFSTPGPFAGDFRDAVEVAVRQWQFTPARTENYEVVTAEGITFNRVTGSQNVETEFDLAFTFQPDGTVRQGEGK